MSNRRKANASVSSGESQIIHTAKKVGDFKLRKWHKLLCEIFMTTLSHSISLIFLGISGMIKY